MAMSLVFSEGSEANRDIQTCEVWRGALCGPNLFSGLPHRDKLIRHIFVRPPSKQMKHRPQS